MADPRTERMEQQLSSLQKTLESFMKASSEQTKKLAESVQASAEQTKKLAASIDDMQSKDYGEDSTAGNRSKKTNGHRNSYKPKLAKMDFPKYKGVDDPTSWICRVEQFFEFQQTEEEDKLPMAAYHLEEEAQMWYQLFRDSEETVTWKSLKAALHIRYGPTVFEDHFGDLTKLQQIGTVRDYQLKFEQLLSRVGKLSIPHQLGCFVSGLKGNLRTEVQAMKPSTLTEAIGLARLYEAKNWSSKKTPIQEDRRMGFKESAPPWPSSSQNHSKSPATRRLNTAEMQDRRARGLCFNCEEKFVPGHRCKKLFVIEGIYDTDEEEGDPIEGGEEEPIISLHALTGTPHPQTMRVRGAVGRFGLTILMDTGSTHNFINVQVAARLGLKPTHTGNMRVIVANGEKLECTGVCAGIILWIQGEPFKIDFYLLPMDVCEIVLGTQWLRMLGPIWWDFSKLLMRFSWGGREVELRGIKPPLHRVVANRSMGRELQKRRCGWICQILPANQEDPIEGTLHAITLGTQQGGPSPTEAQLVSLLKAFTELFHEPQGLPPNRPHDHHIQLKPGSGPTNIRPYRYPHYQKNEIEKIVKELLQSGVVRPSTSPYSSPVLLVKKHDGSWRLCVDYRALNHITVKDKFPIPVIDELLDELNGAHFFSKLDLRSGYHQVRMAKGDIEKTAFRTHHGHYEFLVMPFGLTNALSTFQSLMNEIFKESLRRYVLVFFDDILIYSKTWAEHLIHLQKVLEILRDNQLFVRREKCQFGQDTISYLGHIISSKGVAMDHDKISAMVQWPKPGSVKALRGFLGLTGYYRKFIQGYGSIASPLTQLLKKNGFHWTTEAEKAFSHLKQAMTTGPVLALPNFNKQFVVECDASGMGIGAVLMQEGRPIAFFSQALKGRNLSCSTYEKEMMALIASVQKWRPYLLGQKFVIRTDQKSLRYLLDQTIATEAQQKWLVKLMGYDFTIEYKKGATNSAADSLSRREETGTLTAISIPIPHWVEPIKEEVAQDTELQGLIKRIQQGEAIGPWSYKSGLVF
jgi:hypothetical protein